MRRRKSQPREDEDAKFVWNCIAVIPVALAGMFATIVLILWQLVVFVCYHACSWASYTETDMWQPENKSRKDKP